MVGTVPLVARVAAAAAVRAAAAAMVATAAESEGAMVVVEKTAAMQEELAKMTGQRTVPNIFIGGVHIGGNDALVHAKEKGKLEKLFQEAGELQSH